MDGTYDLRVPGGQRSKENTMKLNPQPINLDYKRRKDHEGFVDSLGQTLEVGDEIIVHQYNSVYHAVITRFTPRRIYWTILRCDDSTHDYCFNWENFSQLHYYYGNGAPTGNQAPENNRRLRNVIKFEDAGGNR
jgi:hypothetical protein